MMAFLQKYKAVAILVAIALFGTGMFFVGRGSVKIVEHTAYVTLPTVHDTIPTERLVPYEVLIPSPPILPTKPETIRIAGKPIYIAMVVDTQVIIADYIKENKYKESLFDSKTEGACSVDLSVQYNKLKHLSYTYTPVQKVIVKEKIQTLTPFISGRYGTRGDVGVGAGCFYHNLGVEALYCSDFKVKWVEIGAKVKF